MMLEEDVFFDLFVWLHYDSYTPQSCHPDPPLLERERECVCVHVCVCVFFDLHHRGYRGQDHIL